MKDSSHKEMTAARLEDMCELAVKRGKPVYSAFLNDSEQFLAAKQLGKRHGISVMFWGGSDVCTRKMLRVTPDDAYNDEDDAHGDFPVYAVTLTFRKADKPGHRDILGAVMGLGIERETVGDIFIGEGAAAIFCTKTARDMISDSLVSVGRIGVSVSDGLTEAAEAAVRPVEFSNTEINIASERADCIVSGITGLSREKSAAFIRSGSFMLNYDECDNVSRSIAEGDVLTLRGYGKYIVCGDAVNTKKGRLRITLKKYI